MSIHHWMDKHLWNIYTTEHTHATAWMTLQSSIPGERSRTPRAALWFHYLKLWRRPKFRDRDQINGWQGWDEGGGWLPGNLRELFGVMDLVYILDTVMLRWWYIFARPYQTVHVKGVCVCKFDLNKPFSQRQGYGIPIVAQWVLRIQLQRLGSPWRCRFDPWPGEVG